MMVLLERSHQSHRNAHRRHGWLQRRIPLIAKRCFDLGNEETSTLFPCSPTSPSGSGSELTGDGSLLPHFIAIRNGDDLHIDTVREGNEHVLGARFADANFFVREDVKLRLKIIVPQLSGLTFHTKLGSMLDKSDRMLKLGANWVPCLASKTMKLIKYPSRAHLPRQSRPRHSDGHRNDLPARHHRRRICLAKRRTRKDVARRLVSNIKPSRKQRLVSRLRWQTDLIHSLVSSPRDLAPTGAKDPFGLRRAAIGVVQPLIEHDLDFDLAKAVKESAKTQPIEVNSRSAKANP